MTPAIVCLLWPRYYDAVERFVASRAGTALLTYSWLIDDAILENARRFEKYGCELVIVDQLLSQDDLTALREDAKSLLALSQDALRSREWQTGMPVAGSVEDLAQLIGERLAANLALELAMVRSLELAARRYDIDLIVASEDVMTVGKMTMLWARSHAIPSLHLAHSIPLLGFYTVHAELVADILAVYGERTLEAVRDAGMDEGRCRVTGNPAWDRYPSLVSRRSELRREVCQRHNLDSDRPIVVFATTWSAGMTSGDERDCYARTLRDFLSAIKQLRELGMPVQGVVKDRPSNAASGVEVFQAAMSAIGLAPGTAIHTNDQPEPWVVAADVVIGLESNILVEAMLAGVPAINHTTDTAQRYGPGFDVLSGVIEVFTVAELVAAVRRCIEDPAFRAERLALMAQAAPRYNVTVDGSAAERVAQLMREMTQRAVAASPDSWEPTENYVWKQLSRQEDTELKGAYHDHARKELLVLMDRPPRCVLDVGCATGATGELIKTAWPDSHVTGIELNRAAAVRAVARIDKVIGEKLEDIDFAAEGIAPGSIDTVLLADVLEHLYDPWDALLRIRPLLTEDAQVLVSLPNARNLWLLNELASGRFPYVAEGLLDITHIRWFTRAEMEKMLRETGYRVVKSARTPTAGLQDLTRPAGSTTVETEKIVLKDVSDEEFEDLKALQIMFLAKPLKAGEETGQTPQDFYQLWQLGHSYLKRDALWIAERMDALIAKPCFHLAIIVPEGGEDRLANNIKALGHQFYPHWRLTIVSAESMHLAVQDVANIAWIQALGEQHLAMANRALLEGAADWVGMWEAGDKLAPHALFSYADKAVRHPEIRVFYSDEDRVDADDAHSTPFFKTDFNLEMLRAAPFVVGGLLLCRCDLFAELKGFDPDTEGVETFDLALRAWEKVGHAGIGHIADVLYHRHADGGHCRLDSAQVVSTHRRALDAHLTRCGIHAELEEGLLPGTLHVRYPVKGNPLVSILVPTKNQVEMLKRCLTSLIEGTGYSNCEILVLDNGSDETEAVAYLNELKALNSPRLKVLDCAGPFNFSAMNNRGARAAQGEYLLLLNNDTAVLHEEWLEEMLGIAQQPDVGAVGAKLFYPDGKIQHAGVILGMNDTPADHPFIGQEADADGYFGRAKLTQEYSAVTAACLLLKKSVYLDVGGLDEMRFQVSYNDVDFCQRLRHQGYRNVFTPHARLLHEGSVSQKAAVEDSAQTAKQARFAEEQNRFFDAWRHDVAFDPAYNRNLSTHGRDFLIEVAPALSWDPEWRPRPRILAHPADRFGCGEYRVIAPMRALNDAGCIMGWETGNYLTPPELFRMEPDTILLQRQVDPHQIELMERYIRYSKAFRIYEIDDLITNIPIRSIRKKHFVEQKDLHKRFRKGISMCDRFIVSTDYLAEQYKGYIDDIVVVQNYVERARWGELKPARRHREKARVGWAGSVTHDGDLAVIFDVVKATTKEVDWVFFGMCPDEIRPFVAEFHPGMGLEDYPAKLASLDLDLAVAPLEDVPFNHGKSHLRLLEYGVLGYPVICTDLTPYRGNYPVTRVASRFKDWVETIRSHVADRDELARRGDALRDYINANWILEDNLDVWAKAWLP